MIHTLFKKLGAVIFTLIIIIYCMPLMITFTNSFMSTDEIHSTYAIEETVPDVGNRFAELSIIPDMLTFEQYIKLFFETPVYMNALWNSIFLAVPIIVGQLFVAVIMAYGFTFFTFKYKTYLFLIYIIVMLLPLQATLVPNYIIADLLNIKDSYAAIILPGIFNPFGVFILYQHMKLIPKTYLEAAQIDGAGDFVCITRIVLPQITGGIISLTILNFFEYWNIIEQGVVFIQERSRQPLSLLLASIPDQELGLRFAGSFFYALPVLLVVFYCFDYLKIGIKSSGIKG